jgi:choline dehydrogenase-like flavoprotein
MASERYDVIIIGTGAGGGTLAHRLAPTGKRILLLERGDFLPRERDNWDPTAVFVQSKIQGAGDLVRQGRPGFPSRHPLLRRRQHQILRRRAVPPAQGGFR